MKKFMKKATWIMAVLMMCLMTATAFAANPEKIQKEQTEIEELSEKALQNLYAKVPSAERVIENCYAYATLSNTGMKLGIFGDAHGRGLAINNETGERLYMRMKEMGLGLGLGVKEYDLIFVIGTEAAASDGVTGDSIEGASIAAKGVWVYQITKKGLTLDASIKGTKIYPDKKLNQYEEQSE